MLTQLQLAHQSALERTNALKREIDRLRAKNPLFQLLGVFLSSSATCSTRFSPPSNP